MGRFFVRDGVTDFGDEMGNKFSGMTNLEIVETLLFERNPFHSEKEKQEVWDELVARGLDPGYSGIGQAMDMAGGGSTYLGTRDYAIEFMKRCLVLAETRGAHNAPGKPPAANEPNEGENE